MVKFPTVFSLILTMFLTPQDMENKDKIEAIIPRIGMVYSMLMQGRNKELSRIQRITSLFLFDNICDQKVNKCFILFMYREFILDSFIMQW